MKHQASQAQFKMADGDLGGTDGPANGSIGDQIDHNGKCRCGT